MRTTIIYDNTAYRDDLKADWGFSAHIDAHGRYILFDTGANGRLLISNMNKLHIEPDKITDIFISHAHWDHVGGLDDFLALNNNLTVWVPSSYPDVKNARRVISIHDPRKLYEGLYSTGELADIEQSLCVRTKKGIIIIAGCSHPRMEDIIHAASMFGHVHGVIGGLHGNSPESLAGLDMICATHCTQYKTAIKALYPLSYIEGGAGKVIEIPDA